MTTTQRTYPHGLFSWADVAVPDPRAGAQFYSALFGWETDDQFDADGGYMYTMFRKQGDAVAGIGEMPEGMLAAGAPPSWQSYVTVDDLDATTTIVEANGGAVMHVMDLDPVGRMAVVGDPSGAVLMLWEAGTHTGADLFTGHGTMSWNELAARDVAKAQSFYAEVLGWRYEDAPGPFDYQLIMMDTKIDEQPYMFDTFNGGMMLMDDTWPAEMPSHWMVYFTVDNVDGPGWQRRWFGRRSCSTSVRHAKRSYCGHQRQPGCSLFDNRPLTGGGPGRGITPSCQTGFRSDSTLPCGVESRPGRVASGPSRVWAESRPADRIVSCS